jgi:hypothetical protein
VRLMLHEAALKRDFSEFLIVFPANHHSTIDPYLSNTAPSEGPEPSSFNLDISLTLGWLQNKEDSKSRDIVEAVSRLLPTEAAQVRYHIKSYGIFGEQSELRQIYIGFPCKFSTHRLLHIHLAHTTGPLVPRHQEHSRLTTH